MHDWIHPDLLKHLNGIFLFIERLNSIQHNIPELEDLTQEESEALAWFNSLPRYCNNQAIIVPILSSEMCDGFIEYIDISSDLFAVNIEEDAEYQIPELILSNVDPEFYNVLIEFSKSTLFLIFNLFWGKYPDRVESIQLAKYTADGIKRTGWHHDANSNMTAVINLDPDLYTGGGTDLRTSIIDYEHIPPVPKGHALIFNGNSILHRGTEVTSGTRNLLVYWMTTDREPNG